MSAHKVPFEFYQSPIEQMPHKATTGTLVVDRFGCVIPVDTTAGAAALTLARPTKAGILGTVQLEVDGGDLTLTVTGGYNAAADTSIVFADAGDFVMFYSFDVAGTLYWRVLRNVGTDVMSEATTRGDAVADEHGAGAEGTGILPKTYRYTRDGTIITEIHLDITGLKCKGTAQGDCIALTGAGYIGRNVVATNGIIYRIEMTCLEVPAGSGSATLDIDLMSEDDGDVAYDGPVDDTVFAKGASWAAGQTGVDDVPAIPADDYFYLGEGDTAATDGVYTAGQFIIRLFGHAVLS